VGVVAKPSRRLSKVLSFSQQGSAEFPRPSEHILKYVFVYGLQMRRVESAANGIL
jgi:hypothetical protein